MAEAILFPKAESQVYILHLHLEAAGGKPDISPWQRTKCLILSRLRGEGVEAGLPALFSACLGYPV